MLRPENSNYFLNKNYVLIRFVYVDPKEVSFLKKSLIENNLRFLLLTKKNFYLLKNFLNLNSLKEIHTSKIYLVFSNNDEMKEEDFFFYLKKNLTKNLKNSSYNFLLNKFKSDKIRPFFLNLYDSKNFKEEKLFLQFFQFLFFIDLFFLFNILEENINN